MPVDVKKTLQEMKEFDKHFDAYETEISKEIVDIKLSLNRDLIKEIWNTALEAAAQMNENKGMIGMKEIAVEIRQLKIGAKQNG